MYPKWLARSVNGNLDYNLLSDSWWYFAPHPLGDWQPKGCIPLPTNMEVHKAPFQEERLVLRGSVDTSMRVGRASPIEMGWTTQLKQPSGDVSEPKGVLLVIAANFNEGIENTHVSHLLKTDGCQNGRPEPCRNKKADSPAPVCGWDCPLLILYLC